MSCKLHPTLKANFFNRALSTKYPSTWLILKKLLLKITQSALPSPLVSAVNDKQFLGEVEAADARANRDGDVAPKFYLIKEYPF
jgi:hypothetical protein